MRSRAATLGALLAVGRRPDLWSEAIGAARALAPRRWWRRWPPIPFPDRAYWRFRMVTAYGGTGDGAPRSEDVVAYLEWRRSRRGRPPALR